MEGNNYMIIFNLAFEIATVRKQLLRVTKYILMKMSVDSGNLIIFT